MACCCVSRADGRGDLDEFILNEFVRRDYSRLVNAVALVTGNYPAAEDLVQEAVARALVQLDRGEAIESLPNWVATVAFNLSRSSWRRLVAERKAQERLNVAMSSPPPGEDNVDVARALATLPPRQREVAVLRYLLGMSTREAAEVLGVGEGTVRNSLSKARAALAAQLAVQDEEVSSDAEDG
jgi:RNA polymerase sigma factor (sigma-70 family)